MSGEVLQYVFSLVCGQRNCFIVDGAPLCVCQRCLGLYAGAALTAAWLAATGLWRRGLPCRSVLVLHAAALLAAMLGGLHLIDAGPTWRFTCGLWTGHVTISWLIGGTVHPRTAPKPWRKRDKLAALTAVALLSIAGLAVNGLLSAGAGFWNALACAGVLVLISALIAATLGALSYASSLLRPSKSDDAHDQIVPRSAAQ